jgi:hypothetical protein
MLERRRPRDQPRVDLAEAGAARRGGEFLGARYHCGSSAGTDSRARSKLGVECLAQASRHCPRRPSRRRSGRRASARGRSPARDRVPSSIQCRAALEKPRRTRRSMSPARQAERLGVDEPVRRAPERRSSQANCRSRARSRRADDLLVSGRRRSRRRGSARPAAGRAGRAPPRRARNERRRPTRSPRRPICWSRRRLTAQSVAPTRDRRLRPSGRRARRVGELQLEEPALAFGDRC